MRFLKERRFNPVIAGLVTAPASQPMEGTKQNDKTENLSFTASMRTGRSNVVKGCFVYFSQTEEYGIITKTLNLQSEVVGS